MHDVGEDGDGPSVYALHGLPPLLLHNNFHA